MNLIRNTQEDKNDNGSPSPEAPNMYKQLISSLPNDGGSLLAGTTFFQFQRLHQGFWYNESFLEGLLAAQDHFKAQPSDIFLCSPPRSGTAWLKTLSYSIFTRDNLNINHPDEIFTSILVTSMPHDLIPFLEGDIGPISHKFNRDSLNLPLIATHSPYSALPKSIISEGCKIVYICRNPKDAFVSTWHFINKLRRSGYNEGEPIPIEKSLDYFCQGISGYGPYWDHVLGYWEASVVRPDSILFLKYEDMMRDTITHVKQLAQFLGKPFTPEEEDEGAAEKIVEMCSFEKLSNLDVNKTGKHREGTPLEMDNNVYFRKGKVGDYTNYLSEEMIDRIDQMTKEKLQGSGLTL